MQELNNEHSKVRDLVYSSMETGNHGRARTVLHELGDTDPEFARTLHMDVVADYGIAL